MIIHNLEQLKNRYLLSCTLALYPACQVYRLAQYALSDEQDPYIQQEEFPYLIKRASLGAAGVAFIEISHIADKLLKVLYKKQCKTNTIAKIFFLFVALPIIYEGLKLSNRKIKKTSKSLPYIKAAASLATCFFSYKFVKMIAPKSPRFNG